MSNIVITSQLKSLYQWGTGHPEEAYNTQRHFSQTAIGISQFTSLMQFLSNNKAAALTTQLLFLQKSNLIAQSFLLFTLILSPILEASIINWIGFDPIGIRAHSLATIWMKKFNGTIPRDCLFSHMQKAAVVGLPFTWKLLAMLFGVLFFGSSVLVFERYSRLKGGEEQPLLENSPGEDDTVSLD